MPVFDSIDLQQIRQQNLNHTFPYVIDVIWSWNNVSLNQYKARMFFSIMIHQATMLFIFSRLQARRSCSPDTHSCRIFSTQEIAKNIVIK